MFEIDHAEDPFAWYHDDEESNHPEIKRTIMQQVVNGIVTLFVLTLLSVIFSLITWWIFTSISSFWLAVVACLVPGYLAFLLSLTTIALIVSIIVCGIASLYNKVISRK